MVATSPSTPEPAIEALTAELHRRSVRLEELSQDPKMSQSARDQIHGEVIGLRGALGIALGGTVRGGSADRMAWEHYRTWKQRRAEKGIPFWGDSEDRDRGAPPDYYLTEAELDADDTKPPA